MHQLAASAIGPLLCALDPDDVIVDEGCVLDVGSARLHDRTSFDALSRRPKNRGPFQRVPVMARAIFDRLG
jgi:hypothetical protein